MNAQGKITYLINQFTLFFFLFIGGLAASRISFEWLFPRFLWLGNPILILPTIAVATFILWLIGSSKIENRAIKLAPLLLNFIYLSNPAVDLVQSRSIFLASLWLCGLLFLHAQVKKNPGLGILFIILALLPIYLLTTSPLVGQNDVFEFQVVTPKLGIVHPTGYPLYLLLGRLFTFIPLSSVAWRLNFGSTVFAITAMSVLYWGLQLWWQRPLPAILAATAIGLSPTLWSQAIVAEVYALHALIVSLIIFLLLKVEQGQKEETGHSLTPAHIFLIAAVLGLGMTNHVTTIFLLPPTLIALFFFLATKTFL